MSARLGANEAANHYAMAQPDRVTSKYYHPANPTMVTKPATALPSGRFTGQLPRGPNSTVAAPSDWMSGDRQKLAERGDLSSKIAKPKVVPLRWTVGILQVGIDRSASTRLMSLTSRTDALCSCRNSRRRSASRSPSACRSRPWLCHHALSHLLHRARYLGALSQSMTHARELSRPALHHRPADRNCLTG